MYYLVHIVIKVYVVSLLVSAFICHAASASPINLPDTVINALNKAGVSTNNVSVYVQALPAKPSQIKPPLVNFQATQALNPASTMKLVTSYAGLAILGPNYTWKTDVYHDGVVDNGVLEGNLYLKGYGDPQFSQDDFRHLLKRVYDSGIISIAGDVVIDNSYFASTSPHAGSFDNEPLRAYNATPNAFIVNGKSTGFKFDSDTNQVSITAEPAFPSLKINHQLKVGKGDCNFWRNQLRYSTETSPATQYNVEETTVTFNGIYPANCTDKYLELLALDENHYHISLFKNVWRNLGGEFRGGLRLAVVPTSATKLTQHYSKSLAQVLIDLNKWSNNLMARQLLLTIGATQHSAPATEQKGALAIQQWFANQGLKFDELEIENGSGLSRIARISAQRLGEMLVGAYFHPVMPELMSSLPVLGLDGTMRNRLKTSQVLRQGHFKTGSLNNVFSIAGYLLSQTGERYVVVFMTNDTKAALTKPAQDALLEWVYMQP
jgi:serine-type D-Ala-D-Ala carboxypeptidase/endopeptidase (penicillin-binding protein 4)